MKRNKPKQVERYYIDDKPDISALFVVRDRKNNIIGEYEHKKKTTIEATYKTYQNELKANQHSSKNFWKMWDKNVQQNHPKDR